VGYSGHENGVAISLAAVALGISSLERHITLDRTMYGSDQAASLELKGMKDLSQSMKKIIKAFHILTLPIIFNYHTIEIFRKIYIISTTYNFIFNIICFT
jgi:sialic acid synthase SpsE